MDVTSIESKVKALTLESRKSPCSAASCFRDSTDCWFSLSGVNPDDANAMEQWHQARLKFALEQQKREREDVTFDRHCLFCRKHFKRNRSVLLFHLVEQHNFLIGAPDNIVFTNELLDILEKMLERRQCFYCEKIFKDWMTLKEHMRKKQHKLINPKNKTFDRFYIINYLELGKTWTEIQQEEDGFSQGDSDGKEMDLMDCEDENCGYICLFCDIKMEDSEPIFHHMKQDHHFDFRGLQKSHDLSFYRQIKLINYIRRKVHEKECITCDAKFCFHEQLLDHLMNSGHISSLPDPSKWDQTMFYFSTFENDNLLCALDADDLDVECVYPEDV